MFRMNDEPDPDYRHGNCGWNPTSRGDKIFRKKGARSHQAEVERGDRMEIGNQRRRHLTVVVLHQYSKRHAKREQESSTLASLSNSSPAARAVPLEGSLAQQFTLSRGRSRRVRKRRERRTFCCSLSCKSFGVPVHWSNESGATISGGESEESEPPKVCACVCGSSSSSTVLA
ncbi:hypothetical protein CpipJ_CPIJ011234 [Culex quinquefasciatus]|uniref:Uncharacterized protein n=1 Tax=Culex quinquefasciatus TaxID=7176 RepID=B0WWZ4_CULQU|nr:hypothetical protein CpipJ_CPIJ011234 [Culex quinquefasciatus]|eukprot:XP_001861916.1 hypothetical protein CpipJ_CPIJ011234 [Culex quinquefasciatus]